MRRLCLVLVLAASACDSGGVGGAAKSFLEFAETGDAPQRADAVKAGKVPPVVVAARRTEDGARPRVDLDLELPMQVSDAEVRAVLEAAARGPQGRGYAAVRVRAWPGRLHRVVGPFGTLVVARDGRGWTGSEAYGTRVLVAEHLGGPLSIEESRALTALDAALAAGVEGDAAVSGAAKATGLGPKAVEDAWEKARALYPPRAGHGG